MRKYRKAGAAGSHGLKVPKTLKMVTGFRGGQTKGHNPFEGLRVMPSNLQPDERTWGIVRPCRALTP